jgi:hypothetical protein
MSFPEQGVRDYSKAITNEKPRACAATFPIRQQRVGRLVAKLKAEAVQPESLSLAKSTISFMCGSGAVF